MHLLSFHSFARVSVQLGTLQIRIIICLGIGIVLLRLFQAPLRHGLCRRCKFRCYRSTALFGADGGAAFFVSSFEGIILRPLCLALNDGVPAAGDFLAIV